MPFVPNIVFTSLIKINGRLREVNFRKRPDNSYETDTNDERGNRYFFNMIKKDDHSWSIEGNDVPEWLVHHASLIGDAIKNDES